MITDTQSKDRKAIQEAEEKGKLSWKVSPYDPQTMPPCHVNIARPANPHSYSVKLQRENDSDLEQYSSHPESGPSDVAMVQWCGREIIPGAVVLRLEHRYLDQWWS